MGVELTPERARRLERRFKLAGLIIAIVATGLYLVGFRVFFWPLAVVGWLLLARSLQWDGWLTGYQAAQKDAARNRADREEPR